MSCICCDPYSPTMELCGECKRHRAGEHKAKQDYLATLAKIDRSHIRHHQREAEKLREWGEKVTPDA